MEREGLKEQNDLIQLISRSCDEQDILSVSRELGIDSSEFYARSLTMRRLAEDFVQRVYQLGKQEKLKECIRKKSINQFSKISINNKSAEKFSTFLNDVLNKLSNIDEENFPESELFEPIEFEDKMRNRAKLSEDIIIQGINMKPDIIVLRRKAYAFDYKKYSTLIQKLAKYYLYTICREYPRDQYDANKRFVILRNTLIDMISEELYSRDDEIEEYIDGIIFDTISKCLIFND